MSAPELLKRFVVIAFALAFLGSCGGGDKKEAGSKAKDQCPEELEFSLGTVPKGFPSTLEAGPASGEPAVKNAAQWHIDGPEGKYIEVFRGARRTQFTNGVPVSVLRGMGVLAKIDNIYAMKFRLGRERCSRYQLESRGLTAKEIKAIASGIEQ